MTGGQLDELVPVSEQRVSHAIGRILLQATNAADIAHERDRVERPLVEADGRPSRKRGWLRPYSDTVGEGSGHWDKLAAASD